MFYDLHIHSALSPCGEDSMTVNNIVNMAMIKELDLIAITDHNSLRQLDHLKEIAHHKIRFIYGVELQTKEEIHVLAYFKDDKYLKEVQAWIDKHLIYIENVPEFFGNQLILDKNDEIKEIEKRLLLSSLDLSIDEVCRTIHRFHGIVVLAHVLDKRYSIFENLGFIPENLEYDGIEVKSAKQEEMVRLKTPYLKDVIFFHSSDAHQLIDISEPLYSISEEEFNNLWR